MKIVPFNMVQQSICETHGVWGATPCPWPDCPQGMQEPQFRMHTIMDGKPHTVFTRREWLSPLGGSYYTWDSDEVPNWFSTSSTYWNEARRLKLANNIFPETIYHYTSLDGLVGIVESQSLWLSDYSYLNDTRELTHGLDIVRGVIDDIAKNESNDNVLNLLQSWLQGIEKSENRVCVASLSADGDSLSQWRAYGRIAIGFGVYGLAQRSYPSILRPVEYDSATQRRLVAVFLKHLCQAYAVDIRDNRLERIPHVYHDMEKILELAVFFKDSAFRTESEYRLAYIESPDTLTALGHSLPPKHFRIARSRLMPYVSSRELPYSSRDSKPIAISSIVLGPENDALLERGVREFLRSRDLEGVTILRSAVPFRT